MKCTIDIITEMLISVLVMTISRKPISSLDRTNRKSIRKKCSYPWFFLTEIWSSLCPKFLAILLIQFLSQKWRDLTLYLAHLLEHECLLFEFYPENSEHLILK